MKNIKIKCPSCKEEVWVTILDFKKIPQECPSCYVLLDIVKNKATISTYKPKQINNLSKLKDLIELNLES